jgi:cyclic patellamide precursor peptide PatG
MDVRPCGACLDYLAVWYPAIYPHAIACHERNSSLTAVEVRTLLLSGVRRVVDTVFSFTNRTTDVSEKVYVRVDVTEEFPFLVTSSRLTSTVLAHV